ncbi:hypothetical protein D3Z38_10140 [Clostridiales bacterium]|nr:hypothetical protein [Clostridiales bacterium]
MDKHRLDHSGPLFCWSVASGREHAVASGKSVKSFFVASRRLTVPIVIGVAAAGWYDSWTIVGLAECGYTMGIVTLLIFVAPEAILRLPLAVIIGPHVRDKIPDWVVTVPDMMAYLYSKKVKLISAVTYIANLLYDSALLCAIAEVLKLVTGMPMLWSLAISAAAQSGADIKIAYSLMLSMGVSFSAVMVFAGMAAVAFFGDVAASPSEGFWALVFSVLPVGFRGLFVAALCAAVMSTVSSDWLLFATCAVNDIYRGFLRPQMSEASTVVGMRVAVVVFGVICTIGTMFWADGIANAWYYLGGFLFAMFFIPITCGLFYKKKSASGALWCIVYSAFMYVLWEFVLGCPFAVPSSLFVSVTGAVIYFIVCNATYKKESGGQLGSGAVE